MVDTHSHIWTKSPTPGKEKCSVCGKERLAAGTPKPPGTDPFKAN